MTYHSDAHNYGFLLAEIVPWLREQGVQIEREMNADTESLTADYAINPDISELTGEYTPENAACLILGVNPQRNDNRVNDTDSAFVQKRDSLTRSIKSFYRDELRLQKIARLNDNLFSGISGITSEDVENWCNQNGYFWCVPTKKQTDISKTILSSIDATALVREVAELKGRLKDESDNHTALRKAAEERDGLKESCRALSIKLEELIGEQGIATATISRLEADLMTGKSKSFMLELLGGLVTSLLYVDIFKQGNIEVGKVTSALECVGLGLTPETVSKYLKQSATRLSDSNQAEGIIKYLENNKK